MRGLGHGVGSGLCLGYRAGGLGLHSLRPRLLNPDTFGFLGRDVSPIFGFASRSLRGGITLI